MSVTTRTITVRVDGDASKANKALTSVGSHAEGLGKRIAKIGGLLAAAFSVQKILQFGKESVQAMMEDQKSAAILAKTLQNVLGARKDEIAAVEAYIRKTEEAVGVQDDALRPAYARLVRATKDTAKATRLMNLALDISAATGSDLQNVASGLTKAFNGNFGALTRMGVSLDKATLKSKDFNKVLGVLEQTFSGSAQTRAQTFAYQMERLKIAFENIKEDLGYALLPSLEKMAQWMNSTGIEAVRNFFAALTGSSVQDKYPRDPMARVADWDKQITPLNEAAQGLGRAFRELGESIGFMNSESNKAAGPDSGLVALLKLLTLISDTITQINKGLLGFATVVEKMNRFGGGSTGITAKIFGWLSILSGADPQLGLEKINGNAIGGTIPAGSTRLVGERGPELWTPSTNGSITPNYQLGGAGSQPLMVNVNVSGSVIHERDLAVRVRDEIAQLMRRRGQNPSILGV